jgi:NADH-quinone oxidoreductase subunit C
MTASLKEKVDSTFDGVRAERVDERRTTVTASKEALLSVLIFLRHEGYDHLNLVSCVDWIGRGTLELAYILSGYLADKEPTDAEAERIVVRTSVSRESPSLLSSITVFPCAEPYERELHELFGIEFVGHPRLTPLFLDREYEIPPFRKDFDSREYVEDVFGSVPPVGEEATNA